MRGAFPAPRTDNPHRGIEGKPMNPGQDPENRAKPRRAPAEYAKYGMLFPLILLNLVVSGFVDHFPLMKGISQWVAVAVLVLTLYVSRVGRAYFLVAASLALITAAAWGPARVHHRVSEIVVVTVFGGLIVLAPVAILRRVRRDFEEGGVGEEVVFGALCAYLYIGNLYAFLYRAVAILSKAPFFAQPGSEDALNYMYFSFITLATVGYGDLSPAFGPGRMLAATEGIVGQLYLVSVVAIVVSAYGKKREPRP